jgi:predicted transcriptional regulator
MKANTGLVIDLFANLARAGVDCPSPPDSGLAGPPLPHRAISRITAGYCLRSLDELRGLFGGDLLTGLIFSAIIDANVAYLDKQSEMIHTDLDDQVPDELRHPTSALAVASRLNLPRETVRRHVRQLESVGACAAVKGGLIVPQATLTWPQIVEATVRNAANLRRLLGELHAAGFPPPLWSAAPQAAQHKATG